MRTQALLVADDPVYGRWLSECLGDDVVILPADATDAEGLAEEVASTPGVGLVFIEFDEAHGRERAGMVEHLLEQHPSLPVVAVGESEQSDAVLAAMRAGAHDYFVLNRDDDNLNALVSRVLSRSGKTVSPHAASTSTGQLLAVLSGPPSSNVPFLSMHMALALLEVSNGESRVLLVDLSMPGGSTLVFLDNDQNYSALDALRDVYRCDQTLIDTAFTRLDNGLFLLSLPEDAVAPSNPDADDLGRLMESFKSFFDYIVVSADVGIGLAPLVTLVQRVDDALLLTDQSVLKSRQNKHFVHALRKADCPLDRMRLVIDHYQPHVGLEAERLASLLDLEFLAKLTFRGQARIEAMNAGESMFEHAPKDPYCREVRELVAQLTGETVSEAERGGVFSRLFG